MNKIFVEIEKSQFYDLLIQFFTTNVDFSIIFGDLDDGVKDEILTFIQYIKSKPKKSELMQYCLSDKAKKNILICIDRVLKKVKT